MAHINDETMIQFFSFLKRTGELRVPQPDRFRALLFCSRRNTATLSARLNPAERHARAGPAKPAEGRRETKDNREAGREKL